MSIGNKFISLEGLKKTYDLLHNETNSVKVIGKASNSSIAKYHFIVGNTYRFINNTSEPISIKTQATEDKNSERIESVGTVLAGKYIDFIPTLSAEYLSIYYNVNGEVEIKDLSLLIFKNEADIQKVREANAFFKLKYVYKAKALGGTVDDNVALQQYINNEWYVYIPAGTYYLKKTVNINLGGRHIEGMTYGFGTVIRPYDNTVTALFSLAAPEPSSLMVDIKNICFQMVNYDGTFNPGSAIATLKDSDNKDLYMIDSKIENCWFNGGNSEAGALKAKALDVMAVQTIITGCWFEMFDTAIKIKSTASIGYEVRDCIFWNNTNALDLCGKGSVRGCNFETMRGGSVLKITNSSNITFSSNRIRLEAPSTLDTTTYESASGIVFNINHASAVAYLYDLEIFDKFDGSSFYNYLLNAPNGKVIGRDIEVSLCPHLSMFQNINPNVNFTRNALENLCIPIEYTGNKTILKGLLPNCEMELESIDATEVQINNKNLCEIQGKTFTGAGGYFNDNEGNGQEIMIPPGDYYFIMHCNNCSGNLYMFFKIFDEQNNNMIDAQPKHIENILKIPFTLENAGKKIVIYTDAAGEYSNIMIIPQDVEDNYVQAKSQIIHLQPNEKLRVPQIENVCIVMSDTGDFKIKAIQTPIGYIQSLSN